ncbi:MAG TPA: hypothetical protein VK760_05435 [Candidatus Acidoferrales bacterium]|nr:hypothetical protein [Candidatus Acidoferrales bacterium]
MTFFLPYYAAAVALLYLELRGAPPRVLPTPALPAWVWIGGLVATYAAQLGAIWYSATAAATAESWRAALPIGVAGHDVPYAGWISAAMLLLSLAQTYALLALYRRPAARVAVVAGAFVLAALSLAAPAFISPDPYAYAGDTLLGRAAYAPPAQAFGGEYGAIDRFFGAPMLPSPYGPLWSIVSQLALAPFGSLLGKLLALRGLGLLSYVALLAALRAFGVPSRALALAALNPGLFMQYVAGAHNDLLGIAALVAAAAFAARNAVIAAALLVVGGLVKLPFVLLGLPVLAAVRSRVARYVCAAAAIAATVAISWWGAGASYFQGLAVHVPAPGPAYALNLVVSLLALAAIAVAFVGGPRVRAAVWLIPLASSYVASWYLIYALPYALARRRMLAYLLIGLPFAAVLVDAKFVQWWTYTLVLPLAVLASVAPRSRPAIAKRRR